MSDVTRMLQAIEQGDERAADELLATVYDELHRMASQKLAGEAPGQTLQTTALIHEAYLRLLPAADDTERSTPAGAAKSLSFRSRGHFFASAAEAMRRILIDNARKKGRLKRGGDRARVDLEIVDPVEQASSDELIALDEALARLEARDKQKATVVKMRYFAGLTLEEVATALNISIPTVHRHWRYARAWLRREMDGG